MGCYELRLKESAEIAVAGGFDYFTTTLSISPMKNAQKLNEIGQRVGEEYGVQYLLISRRRTDIRDPSNCLESMVFIVRIIVDVKFSYKARQAEKRAHPSLLIRNFINRISRKHCTCNNACKTGNSDRGREEIRSLKDLKEYP